VTPGCLGASIASKPFLIASWCEPENAVKTRSPQGALVHGQLVAVLGGALDLVDVAEVDLRVDALREQVDAQGDQVDVAGALAVAEQAALDAVGAGHVAELGGGDRGAAVVVRVQRQDDVLAVAGAGSSTRSSRRRRWAWPSRRWRAG
jgi:hypothetical protein